MVWEPEVSPLLSSDSVHEDSTFFRPEKYLLFGLLFGGGWFDSCVIFIGFSVQRNLNRIKLRINAPIKTWQP